MVLQAAGSGWRRVGCKFMCDGDDGYNCMGLYDLHGRLTVLLLTCHGELAEVRGKMSGMKSIYVGSVLGYGVWVTYNKWIKSYTTIGGNRWE